jgi:NADH dehydrogenase FAD-containing subunit
MYSGMVPGWLAGDYTEQACQLDVAALCQQVGVRWLQAQVGFIKADERLVEAAGVRYEFEFLSINLGGRQQPRAIGADAVAIKPFPAFVAQVAKWDEKLLQAAAGAPFELAVVGGGLGGFELVLGLAARYQAAGPGFKLHWFTSPKGALPRFAAGVRKRALRLLAGKPVVVQPEYFTGSAQERGLLGVLWACQGAAGELVGASGLQLDGGGFIAVDEYFQSLSHPGVFAAGDVCRRLDGTLAPSGVNAVRAGAVLAANLNSWVRRGPCGPIGPLGGCCKLQPWVIAKGWRFMGPGIGRQAGCGG